MYKLIDGDSREFELKGTTARVKKELAELGVKEMDADIDGLVKKLTSKPEELLKFCKVLFRGDFDKVNAEDIDQTVVQEGLIDFFLRPIMLVYKYDSYTNHLNLPTQETGK